MKLAAILLFTLSAHASYSRTDGPRKPCHAPAAVSQQSYAIDGGTRLLFITRYADGSVKRFVIEMPKLRP